MKVQFTVLFLFLALMTGCGGDNTLPPIGKVSGVVTYDGKPLEKATIYFWPVEGGRTSVGTTDANGKYEMVFNSSTKGVQVGMCEVRVSTALDKEIDENDKVIQEAKAETIPKKYNDETTLKYEVKAGSNEINLDLKP